jgi:signal transduction histidine kinase
MRFMPQTMLGRTLAVMIGGIMLVQVLGGILHYREWQNFVENTEHSKLIERMATYVQWMNAATPLQREFLLRSRQPNSMRAWQSSQSVLDEHDVWFGVEVLVRDRLSESLGGIDNKRIRVEDDPRRSDRPRRDTLKHNNDIPHDDNWKEMRRHMFEGGELNDRTNARILVSVQLDDGIWLNMRLPYEGFKPNRYMPIFGPLLFLTLIVALIAVFMMQRANKPLSRMAEAAERLGRDVNAPPMDDKSGPREVREAAHAFNEMQTRLRRFVQDRTHMLAAISHDLRTPITRMRLRAEFIDDEQQREKMLDDLIEMETMIKATMAFARDDVANETVASIDLASLVESICEDCLETGQDVIYEGPEELPFKGRPVGLKRAVSNLIGNAVKYAGSCQVKLSSEKGKVILCVFDKGQGIDEGELEEVFRPFRRIENSRNKETGGFGLGLAIVRSVAHAHGGTATLHNREEGGLEARLVLPV